MGHTANTNIFTRVLDKERSISVSICHEAVKLNPVHLFNLWFVLWVHYLAGKQPANFASRDGSFHISFSAKPLNHAGPLQGKNHQTI